MRAAREHLHIAGRPVMPLVPRFALQVIFVAAVLVAGFATP